MPHPIDSNRGCLFVDCGNRPTFRVVQTWNGKETACCDEHVPGSKPLSGEVLPPPTEPVTRGAYRIFPLDR